MRPAYLTTIAAKAVERVDALRLRGRRADDEAVSLFVGAANALAAIGEDEKARHLGTVAAMLVATHGMAAVGELARP